MTDDRRSFAPYGGRPDGTSGHPPPGLHAVVLAALTIGLLLMGIQLWLLTVALDLYLGGAGRQTWLLALVSGLIFVGGLLMLRLLGRRPRLDGPVGSERDGDDVLAAR